ncbi:MAG: amylo-alpha-1,6-glucosidase [Acidobacteriaceae bacterium]
MLSRRSFMATVTAACLGSWHRLNAAIGGPAKFMPERRTASISERRPSTRIGNFYYQAPNGIAFIKDDAAAFVINPGGSYNAGTVAPDDSFHKVVFSPQTGTPTLRRVEFQWSRVEDAIVGRLTSAEPGEMSFSLQDNWPGFNSRFTSDADGVKGVGSLTAGNTVTWELKSRPELKSADPTQFTVPLAGPTTPTYIVAGFGDLPSFDGIDYRLHQAERAYESRRPKAHGPSGDILAAIADNLNNSRIYSSDNKLVAISVSRTFGARSANACPYFCWDSFFSGLLASLDNPEMGRQTLRAILSYQSSDGLVPNYAHWNDEHANKNVSHPHDMWSNLPSTYRGGISEDRSQPPVGSLCIWKMHQHWPDLDFLREVYPKLALWHGWWLKARNAKNDGLLQWGSSTGKMEAAQDETGWDDTPQFEGVAGVKMVGHTMNAYAVDLCSLWAMDAHYLALIADAIGKPDEAKRHRQEETAMIARIDAKLWNEKLGIYCSRFWDNDDGTPGDFLTRLTPANFYPLICGAPGAERAQKVLSAMTDPTQFWGEWILPTVSRRDPLFLGQTYWHGTIWGPVNYLVFQGVKRYASPELQAEFAQKSVHLFMNNWLADGYCGENFLSIDGSVGGNRNYTWGALMCLIGVESIIDIDDNGIPKLGPGYNEPVELTNLPIAGKPHRISLRLGKPHAIMRS